MLLYLDLVLGLKNLMAEEQERQFISLATCTVAELVQEVCKAGSWKVQSLIN